MALEDAGFNTGLREDDVACDEGGPQRRKTAHDGARRPTTVQRAAARQ
jgi:hypothetical protein